MEVIDRAVVIFADRRSLEANGSVPPWHSLTPEQQDETHALVVEVLHTVDLAAIDVFPGLDPEDE